MSKFNHYAQRANEAAIKALNELEAANKALKDAEARSKAHPVRTSGHIDAEEAAVAARAHADLLAAQAKLKSTQARMGDVSRQLANIRAELAEALSREYSANPADIDTATMELLRSGILQPAEYGRLLNAAKESGNITMTRIIGKHAADAAEKYGADDARRQELQAVAVSVGDDPVAGKLGLFDVVVSGFEHCVNNHHMIQSWPEFTARSVEAL